MIFLQQVTVLILTFNEESNIGRTLDALIGFPEVVVLDSGSTDNTLRVAGGYPNVRVVSRPFDSHSNQWNYGLTACGLKNEWVLALDADYVLPPQLIEEISGLSPSDNLDGYQTGFDYWILGRSLSRSLYPPVTTLYRRIGARYEQDGHTQRVRLEGSVAQLQGRIAHDDRKPLSRWLASQGKYADQEAALLLSKPASELRIQDKLRRLMVITPWLVPLYCLTVGRGVLDGWAGIYYALQRGVAEAVLALKLLEARLAARQESTD